MTAEQSTSFLAGLVGGMLLAIMVGSIVARAMDSALAVLDRRRKPPSKE